MATRAGAQTASTAPTSASSSAASTTTSLATLSLAEALREADAHGFANRIAASATSADRARARLPLQAILPAVRVESGVLRTTDPIGAFGTTLRQRAVTPAAFDPARLNAPAAITNVQGGVVVELPLLNSDAWLGLRAARAAAEASGASAEWTARSLRADVIRAYYGAVLAAEKVTTLESAERAATEATRQVRAMMTQGLVTKADALQANVRTLDLSGQLLAARTDVVTAREQLTLLLGRSPPSVASLPSELPNELPADSLVLAYASAIAHEGRGDSNSALTGDVDRASERADVRAARAGLKAADADLLRGGSTLLPRLNSFARYDWNSANALFAGRPNWTVGVMASWSLFGGNRELADVSGASARADGARAGVQASVARGALEANMARRAVDVAVQRLTLAAESEAQSREAHRLVQKRYSGGLATVAELLGAEAAATSASLSRSAARFAVIDALASYRRALGEDPSALANLDADARARAASVTPPGSEQ